MKIKFVKDATATLASGAEVLFQTGQVEELPDASAHRWVRRGAAVVVEEEDSASPAKKKRGKKPSSD